MVSHPSADPERIVLLSLSSQKQGVRFEDHSCRFHAGEDAFLKRDSFVRFDLAECLALSQIATWVKTGEMRLHKTVAPKVLRSLQEAAVRSYHIPHGCRDLLLEQGLGGTAQD